VALSVRQTGKTKGDMDVPEQMDFLIKIMIGVAVVVGVGFITIVLTSFSMVISAHNERSVTYKELKLQVEEDKDQLNAQNDKIEALIKAINEQKTVQKTN
jgi:cell division protein FtsL